MPKLSGRGTAIVAVAIVLTVGVIAIAQPDVFKELLHTLVAVTDGPG